MDDVTTAVTLVTLEQPDQAEQWFLTICETYDEVADSEDVWAGFSERLPAAAGSSVGSGTVTEWLEGVQALTSDPAALLADLASRRDELVATYWAGLSGLSAADGAAAAGGYPVVEQVEEAGYAAVAETGYAAVEEPGSADRFAWVLAQPGLAGRVESVLQYRPEHYESHLGPYLAQLWGPGWEQHPDEHKQAWLDQALAALETPAAEPAAAEPAEAAVLAEAEQQVAAALAEALAEVPEAAELTDEEIAEVLAEVLAEQSATGGG